MSQYHAWDPERGLRSIREHEHLPGALLPVLHALLEEFGYVDERAVPLVAEALNLSRAEVVGVVNFYDDFRQEPPGRHVLRICRAEACQAMGGESLVEHISRRLDAPPGQTTADGEFTIESVYCLGNCALAPAMMLDGRLHGRVSPALAEALIERASP